MNVLFRCVLILDLSSISRLVEEIKDRFSIEIQNEDVFMATTFEEFIQAIVFVSRGGAAAADVEYDAVKMRANNMDIQFPRQLFINGKFVNAEGGRTIASINPADNTVICEVRIFKFNERDNM